MYREQDGYSDRAVYIVDGEGIVRYSHVAPLLHHLPDIYELLNALDAVRSSSETAKAVGARS